MSRHIRQFPAHSFAFRSGGGGTSSIAAAPVPTPAPPVTATDETVVQAEHDLAQQNLIKKSVKKTIIAGDTGGWNPGSANPQNSDPATGYKHRLG